MKTHTTKIPEVKAETATSQNRKPDLARSSFNSFCNPILELQKTLGNQCVQRWRRSHEIQAKLSMGAAKDICFDLARYAPGTRAGQRLLAHDLTPVIRQRLGPVNPKASAGGVMRRPLPADLIQRSPYKAQILSLEEIGKDAAKERLRQQSGQIAAKVCRSIGRALTPDNCPFVFPAGETVTVVKEKVGGLWLQIDCTGVPGFGPKEQCHLLGAFARRLEPPKTEKTPSPEPPAKIPPAAEPAPEVPVEPEVPVPDREGCTGTMSREISRAVDAAGHDLLSAVAALAERPLAPLTQDAMWLSLRTTSEEDADGAAEKLQRVASDLASTEIVCDDPGVLFCPANTKGYVNPYTGTIHLCKQAWSDANGLSRERMVMHEGLHACAGTSGIDEIYHDSDCGEGDVVGQGRYFRMRNTDSLACFVILLTHSGDTDLGARVRHSQGESLAIRQKPAGDISLDADPKSVQFEILGYEEVGIDKMRWIFIDSEGRKYLLRGPNADEIIAPDEDTDYVRGLYIGAKTRALLNERGVSDLELIVKCRIPEVGEKIIRLDVHFVP